MALTDLEVRQAKPRDRAYKLRGGDGGLYLLVQPNGARYWRRDYQFEDRRSTAAIGVHLPAGTPGDKSVMTLRVPPMKSSPSPGAASRLPGHFFGCQQC